MIYGRGWLRTRAVFVALIDNSTVRFGLTLVGYLLFTSARTTYLTSLLDLKVGSRGLFYNRLFIMRGLFSVIYLIFLCGQFYRFVFFSDVDKFYDYFYNVDPLA